MTNPSAVYSPNTSKTTARRLAPPITRWAMTLGAYDDEAVATLPAQLDLLRTVADLENPALRLGLSIETVKRPRGDLAGLCWLRCITVGGKPDKQAYQTLEDVASVALIDGYHLSHRPEDMPPHGYWYSILSETRDANALPLKRDWSPLVDLLRKQQHEMRVHMFVSVSRGGTPQPGRSLGSPFSVEVSKLGDPGLPAFFAMATTPSSAEVPLELRLTLESPRPLNPALGLTIGRLILGIGVRLHETNHDSAYEDATPLIGPAEAILRAWHAPYGKIQGRGMLGVPTTDIAIRELPQSLKGRPLGYANFHSARYDENVAVNMTDADRLKHVYVLGKTGSGKTNLLKNLALQDIRAGRGVAVISPHPDLPEYLVRNIGDRAADLTFLDLANHKRPPVINPLTLDIEDEHDYAMAVEEVMDIIIRRSYNQFTGPVFEDTVRMILESVKHLEIEGRKLTPSIPLAIELLRTPRMRKWTATCLRENNPDLADLWDTFGDSLATTIAETSRWTLAKFVDFAPNGALRYLTSGDSTFSIRDIFDQRKILIISLPETGMGSNAVEFVGALVFARLYAAAKRSTSRQTPFFVHVDEFQRFVSFELEALVAEARKFNLGLTFAHQNLKQLEAFSRYEGVASARLAETIFSNVGTLVSMKMSGRDVETMSHELELSTGALRQIAQYQALARCVIDGHETRAFTLRIPLANSDGDASAPTVTRKRMGDLKVNVPVATLADRLELDVNAIRTAARAGGPLQMPSKPKPERRVPSASSESSTIGVRNPITTPVREPLTPKTSSLIDEWLRKRDQTRAQEDVESPPPPSTAPQPNDELF